MSEAIRVAPDEKERKSDRSIRENATSGTIRIAPDDEHNAMLVRNTHPPDWENPAPASMYNLVVVGAGTAGLISAAGAAGLGARVALVEKHLLGGDCLNYGCVPSKALIRAARAAADVRDAVKFGVRVPQGTSVDFPAVMERMRRLRAEISPHDSAARFRDMGVDVFLGEGRFTGRNTLSVAGQTLRFRKAVIATGASAVELPLPGLAEAGYLTNETLFGLTELPRRLVVIGAGPIGCEMAQAFARFGSRVSLLEAGSGILPREDRDAAARVERAFEQDGVDLCFGCRITRIEGTVTHKNVHLQHDGKNKEIQADAILLGIGRKPNVDHLGLDAAGVAYDVRAGVSVDDRLRTTNPKIYAAGDVCSRYRFTHAADAMARIVLRGALFFGRGKVSALTIPWCTYTSPEIAHVGMYDHEAKERGIATETFMQELSDVDRAVLDGETGGFVKVLTRAGSDKILGATIVAEHAGEMISELTLAIVGGIGLGRIANVIHPYPTQAEAIKRIADAYNRTKLTPRVKALFERWLAWSR